MKILIIFSSLLLSSCLLAQEIDSSLLLFSNYTDSIKWNISRKYLSVIKHNDTIRKYVFSFSANGVLHTIYYYENENIVREIHLYPNGSIKFNDKLDTKSNNEDRVAVEYYPNGNVKDRHIFKTVPCIQKPGNECGFHTEEGSVIVGRHELFYENGYLQMSGYFREDSCFVECTYDPNGFGIAYEGIKHGVWSYYDEMGAMIRNEEWENGVQIK